MARMKGWLLSAYLFVWIGRIAIIGGACGLVYVTAHFIIKRL